MKNRGENLRLVLRQINQGYNKMTEDYLQRLEKFRDDLYCIRQKYITLNNLSLMGSPTTRQRIDTYEAVIKRLEQLFPELDKQPEAQRIR